MFALKHYFKHNQQGLRVGMNLLNIPLAAIARKPCWCHMRGGIFWLWEIVAELPKFARISCHQVDYCTNNKNQVPGKRLLYNNHNISGNVYA